MYFLLACPRLNSINPIISKAPFGLKERKGKKRILMEKKRKESREK